MKEAIQLGLLGNGIGRSRVKDLHEMLGQLYNLDVRYNLMDLALKAGPVSIRGELERCMKEGYRGVNVTHPYKRDAYNAVNVVESFPEGLTSVNTVMFKDKGMIADNTDYSGFMAAFLNHFGSGFKPGKVLMLGAGGVGLAMAFGLERLGVSEMVIGDLELPLAQNLVTLLKKKDISARVAGDSLVEEMKQADGLINGTPIGMFQYPGNPFPFEGFGGQKWAFDAVYTPVDTVFLQKCRETEIQVLSGFRLFLYQGLNAFAHFTGVEPDGKKAEEEFLRRFPLE